MKTLFVTVGLLSLATLGASGDPKAPAVDAKKLFEAMKQLQGSWEGTSKSGMKENLETKLMAGGSVLMETSSLGMITMYHLDSDRMLLTHYCMAKNQPRLKATSVSPDGKTVTFSFVDGTNLPNRNVGHMDKVVFEFLDKDTYRNKWTWYAKGKEQWMEDFTYRRVKSMGTK